MKQHTIALERVSLLTLLLWLLKLEINITVEDLCNAKLKNQLYGLLCEYEKDRDWEAFLDAILIELMGYPEEEKTPNYYKLFHKISSLRYLSYKYFRSTIFDCMNLVSKR